MTVDTADAKPLDINGFLDRLRQHAVAAGENPTPMAQGTFAMYPMQDGGVMFVASVAEGPMAGTHHHRIPPALIRAACLFAGGEKGKALKALMGMGR